MTVAAVIENNTIKLPPDVQLPDGTKVEVILPEDQQKKDRAPGWMQEFAGCIDTLPPDAAERHTEYAHGRKRHQA